MKKHKLSIILIGIIFIIIGIGIISRDGNLNENNNINNQQLTQKEKLADFEYMYKILKENYPYFEVNKRLNGVDWLGKKEMYRDKIRESSNDESFFNALKEILADLNNGHVGMLDKDSYSYFKSIYEKLNKTDKVHKRGEPWLNQINNSKAVERYSIMEGKEDAKFSADSIFENNVDTKDLKKGKIAYIAIHSFNGLNIEGDMKIIKPYLESIKNYNVLIIDIRGNGGGDSSYWSDNIVPMLINRQLEEKQYVAFRGGEFVEPFIKNKNQYEKLEPISNIYNKNLKKLPSELKEGFKYYYENLNFYKPENSIGFKGKIYLLIDNKVFSSSEGFASFAKSAGFATLVGEKTGGDGIGFDPAICALPNSGYIFKFTQEMGMVSDGSCNFEQKTEPDIEVSAKADSDISKDEAIQTVLKQ